MNNQKAIWNSLINGSPARHKLHQVMNHVASGLSDVVGQPIINDAPRIEKAPINQVTARAGNPGAEMVGVHLAITGGLHGQAILILPVSSALNLVDLLMGDPPGTATELGKMERSAC